MQFVMRLAREFRRADWRRMLPEMSATELGEWGDYFRMQSFSDVWMDAQFASLKALIVRMVSGSSDAAVADFSLLPEENGIPERTDEELMHLGEGISGGVRYGPDSQPRSLIWGLMRQSLKNEIPRIKKPSEWCSQRCRTVFCPYAAFYGASDSGRPADNAGGFFGCNSRIRPCADGGEERTGS